MASSVSLPPFDSLPLQEDGPPGNAWGLFGPNDQLGRLNLLTPATIVSAAQEIKLGIRISLDWPLNKPSFPTFTRKRFEHSTKQLTPNINDDVIHINTQSSSQWDGFRHYAYLKTRQFYGGRQQGDFERNGELGIENYVESGGIMGRGVLLDWAEWAERNGKLLDPFRTGAVEVADLEKIVREKSIELRQGDILFIRVGFTKAYDKLSAAEQEAFPNREPGGLLGLEANKDSLRWLWESGFAAVASDSPSFERSPATGPYNDPDTNIHQWCLAGWGMPLGEMFDLERLAEQCRKLGRWNFFISSVTLKIPGGVASPPNAVAIF